MDSKGLLLVMMSAAPGSDEELNAWATTEHIPERKHMPGFNTAVRFEAVEANPRYLALYDLQDLDVLQSPAYKQISGSNLSPWSKRVLANASHHWRFNGSQVTADATTAPTGKQGPATKLVVITWRAAPNGLEEVLINFLKQQQVQSDVLQARGFAAPGTDSTDYVAIIETNGASAVVEALTAERVELLGRPSDFAQAFTPLG